MWHCFGMWSDANLPSALSTVAGTPICDVAVVVISFKFFESQLFDKLLLLTNAFCVLIWRFAWWRLEYCGGGDFRKPLSSTFPLRTHDVVGMLLIFPPLFIQILLLLLLMSRIVNLPCFPGKARIFSSLSMHVLSVLSGNWDIWDIGTAEPIFEFWSVF